MSQSAATRTGFEVLGIGNAIVDVLARADDALLASLDLPKGAMTLIDTDRMAAIYGRMGPGTEASGGSCANTMAAYADLGGKGAYIGRVRDDQLGEVFGHDMRASGVHFDVPPSPDGPPTARCLILVTDDAQRTMATYLGACVELGPEDIDETLVAASEIIYLEGYLWDRDRAKQACLKAAEIAHANDRRVALTLSDGFCVDRWRDEFKQLIGKHVDILFANEGELTSLFQTDSFDDALQQIRGQVTTAALTRGAKGAVILEHDEVHIIDQTPISPVVDTTGAGDGFAAGFLYGLSHGLGPAKSGWLGNKVAGRIIQHVGARSDGSLRPLLAELA